MTPPSLQLGVIPLASKGRIFLGGGADRPEPRHGSSASDTFKGSVNTLAKTDAYAKGPKTAGYAGLGKY